MKCTNYSERSEANKGDYEKKKNDKCLRSQHFVKAKLLAYEIDLMRGIFYIPSSVEFHHEGNEICTVIYCLFIYYSFYHDEGSSFG